MYFIMQNSHSLKEAFDLLHYDDIYDDTSAILSHAAAGLFHGWRVTILDA